MPSDTALNHALMALLEHVASSNKPITIDYETALKWESGAINAFLRLGLIGTASMAQATECKGCENHCFMDVLTHKYDSKIRAFIVCEDAEMQSHIGRIEIPLEHLKQWKSSTKHLANVISHLLNLDNSSQQTIEGKIRLGMLRSSKGRRWVSLQFEPLSLEINLHLIPINELLYFEGEQLLFDSFRVNELLDSAQQFDNKEYTPSFDKREAGKLKTKAMHQDWKDEYIRLKKEKAGRTDTWCSVQIAKMDIAQGKDSETIRKNMKK